MSRRLKIAPFLFFALTGLVAAHAYANCTSPTGKEADIKYNGDYHTYQFCNGTNWIPYQWGTAWAAQANFNPTIPGGSGFFVLSHNSYNGNLGGRSGADADCLSDITTNTGWKGYSTANGNGQLIGAKVHAFLCDNATCNSPSASTTYFFANAGNSAAGGASFTTDGSGDGPSDSANWAAANYFGGAYSYWTNRRTNTNTLWNNTTGIQGTCGTWNSSSSGSTGDVGNSAQTGPTRWTVFSQFACDTTQHLICYVNP